MKQVKTIGIIGAGISGLVTAKTCLEYGYSIKVFEKDKELGGVWSSSRRYPGVTTQNTKDTYHFSDFPMPKDYPQWPSGDQMQTYLSDYAKKFNVFPFIQFSHEVTNIDFNDDEWSIAGKCGSAIFFEQVDFLVICNGTFSDPFIPHIPGMDSFIASGGQVLHSTEFHSTKIARDKRVMVVGYGKSANDIVEAASREAAVSYLVYREAKWKLPRYVHGINAKYLFLNRLGEALIKPPEQHNRVDRFVNRIGLAKKMLSFMQNYMTQKQSLKEIDLVPKHGIKEYAFGEISMETPGFFKKVLEKKIITKQGEILCLDAKRVMLSSKEIIKSDLLIFGAGFRQTVSFMPEHYRKKLVDTEGNFILYHHILPAGIPSLTFIGYNSSLHTTLSSEIGALWLCEYLNGRVQKPTEAEIKIEGTDFIRWRSQYRMNGASSGLSTMPGTMHHIDLLLKEMDASLPLLSLIPDWLVLTTPSRYKKTRNKVIARNFRKS